MSKEYDLVEVIDTIKKATDDPNWIDTVRGQIQRGEPDQYTNVDHVKNEKLRAWVAEVEDAIDQHISEEMTGGFSLSRYFSKLQEIAGVYTPKPANIQIGDSYGQLRPKHWPKCGDCYGPYCMMNCSGPTQVKQNG
jgi:hypothetical protein